MYKSVSITKFYGTPSLDYGWLAIIDGEKEIYNGRIPYQKAVKLMYKLARELGTHPYMYNNPIAPQISYAEVRGYLE